MSDRGSGGTERISWQPGFLHPPCCDVQLHLRHPPSNPIRVAQPSSDRLTNELSLPQWISSDLFSLGSNLVGARDNGHKQYRSLAEPSNETSAVISYKGRNPSPCTLALLRSHSTALRARLNRPLARTRFAFRRCLVGPAQRKEPQRVFHFPIMQHDSAVDRNRTLMHRNHVCTTTSKDVRLVRQLDGTSI